MSVARSLDGAIDRIVLGATGLAVAAQGARYLIDPAAVLGSTSVTTAGIDDRHVLRAGFGGVLFVAGMFGVVGSVRPSLRDVARGGLFVVLGGLVVGRCVSLLDDGLPSPVLTRLLLVEVVLIAANVVVLRRSGARAGG